MPCVSRGKLSLNHTSKMIGLPDGRITKFFPVFLLHIAATRDEVFAVCDTTGVEFGLAAARRRHHADFAGTLNKSPTSASDIVG
jgi:hypothetical protein